MTTNLDKPLDADPTKPVNTAGPLGADAADSGNDPDGAPEAINAEQEDEEDQAQTVADEAMVRDTAVDGLGSSDKVRSGDDNDDVQDLVDHMHQMERSGVIDMDAYRGERSDDDEEGRFGPDGERP